jgi:hypothetical protein
MVSHGTIIPSFLFVRFGLVLLRVPVELLSEVIRALRSTNIQRDLRSIGWRVSVAHQGAQMVRSQEGLDKQSSPPVAEMTCSFPCTWCPFGKRRTPVVLRSKFSRGGRE